jgi:hypothetical protein
VFGAYRFVVGELDCSLEIRNLKIEKSLRTGALEAISPWMSPAGRASAWARPVVFLRVRLQLCLGFKLYERPIALAKLEDLVSAAPTY